MGNMVPREIPQLQETLSLNTDRYFSQMCIEENDLVAGGEPILEYTNGTSLVTPYDLIHLNEYDWFIRCTGRWYLYFSRC